MASLRDKTVSGIFWSFLQKGGSRGIIFVVTIILARILTPNDFGLIGMLTIFIQVSQVLVVAGFNQALIQKKNTNEEDYSSVFYINLVVSLAMYLVLFFAAPFIAEFYNQPILIDLTRVLSLVFVINAFSYVQEARLTKEMRFKTLMLIHIPATVIGGIVSVVLAFLNFGVWSLIALQLVYRFAYAVQIWIYSKWKPLFSFNKDSARGLFSFGSKLMLSQVINTIFRNSYLIVIGKFFPLASVGYYQNANNLVQYPTSTFTSALKNVTFSAFSSIQDNNKKLKDGYKKVVLQLLFWLCPAFVLASALTVPLFRLIFTEKWLPAVPYFRLLCIVGILWPINDYNLSIVNIKGRSDITLKLEILKKAIIAVSLVIAIPFGIWIVIIAQVFNTFVSFFLNSYYSGRFIQYPVLEQIKDISSVLLLSIGMGLIVFGVDHYMVNQPDLIRLLVGGVLGAVVYWITAKYLRFEPYTEFLKIFHDKFVKRYIG